MSNLSGLVQAVGFRLLPARDRPSTRACDVVIPCLEKDAPTLRLALAGLRRHLLHPIGSITIVSPESLVLRDLAGEFGARWLEETEFLGFSSASLPKNPLGPDRRGWIFQQLIKLSADRIGSEPWVFLLDADTVLLRNQSFERRGRLLVQTARERHGPYRTNLSRLLPGLPLSERSYVCHHFFLPRGVLGDIRAALEAEHKTDWVTAILSSIDPREASGFSEYELLGSWLASRDQNSVELDDFRNALMSRTEFEAKPWKRWVFPFLFRTASFHVYAN